MAYFIFLKNLDDVFGSLYKIAENQNDLNNLSIDPNSYKVIENNNINFNDVKFGNKIAVKYVNDNIEFLDNANLFSKKEHLENYISVFKEKINEFLKNNPNHTFFNRWNNYYNQLNNLDLDTIIYPLNKSLEQYFNDLGQPSYNILQIP